MDEFFKARDYLIEQGITQPEVGIVLGTGLHQLINYIDVKQTISYSQIPGFPISTVEFHKLNLIYGTIANKNVLVMQGRLHAYEGYSMQQIVFPIRVMKLLGVQKLFLSNAAGGININLKKGDLVLIDDHINLLYGNPLSGKNYDELGPRFPDMSEPYDPYLKSLLQQKASELNINLNYLTYFLFMVQR